MSNLAGLVGWVAGLWMVVKLFQKKGVLHGILGLIFIIYPFIWGLIHFKEEDIKKPMTVWLIAIGVGIVLSIIGIFTGGSGNESSFLSLFI
jgi:peptidoglycan biosynthesis protein MviN/MurJ (putative lipid II flippase)